MKTSEKIETVSSLMRASIKASEEILRNEGIIVEVETKLIWKNNPKQEE